tara:strand:+ start:494 stop:1555 length:1062 start_codon:yes stop_codon:yes gene_type:complete
MTINPQIKSDLNYIHKNFDKKKIFKNKNVLITGYNGFIGYELSKYLIYFKKKLKINFLYLTDIKFKKKRFEDKKIILKKFDVIQENLENIVNKKIHIIIHAASIASPKLYRKNPIQTIESNVVGLTKLLKYSYKKKIDRLLYFSSSEIYGSPDKKNIPTKEDYNGNVSTTGPRACYDESKRFCETLCSIYNTNYGSPVRVVRPFNNYGPGMKLEDGRLPADIAKNILKNRDIIIHSDGTPTRTFCYIADAIVGYLKVLSFNKFEIFNVGNDKGEINVKNFSKIFLDIYKKKFNIKNKSKIKFKKSSEKNYLKDNPYRRCPNIYKAKKLLNFKPKINLREGLHNYLNFLKYNNE